MQTGENEQALRKILDMTRFISITILLIHCYYYLHGAFAIWGLTHPLGDRILGNISDAGLFSNFHKSKLIALAFLSISLMGTKGKKDENQNYSTAFSYLLTGLLLYLFSHLFLFPKMGMTAQAAIYMVIVAVGFLLILSGGTMLSRIIKDSLKGDIFNRDQETFPQEERRIENEFSINLSTTYNLKGKERKGYINIVSPARATIVLGNPGSGKSVYCIREFITQGLSKGPEPYSMLVYDFKFPDLSLIAYNHWLKNKHRYKGKSECIFINFDDLTRTHRGNVFDPLGMTDITDAAESARTILLGLNASWKTRQGDFFVESPINFVTAVIWFLRKYEDGKYCTLPHVLELIQVKYDHLFTLFRTEAAKECRALIDPFLSAYLNDVMEQLEGQIASAKIALARLSSPQLYFVLSGNDFTLDINNPDHPKVFCMGNNPQKIQTYGAVLSLYVNRLLKIINKKDKQKSLLIFDEFPTLTTDIIPTIATGRSNKIGVCLGIQDASQLRKDYGREQAEVIMSTVGNIIAGQVTGDTAKQLSERIGKIMQDRQSLSINSNDTSISKSKQLDYAVPASKIAGLSSGEFVGLVADTPEQKILNKAFHCQIDIDFDAINQEERAYKPIPIIRKVDHSIVQRNYQEIIKDVQRIVSTELQRMAGDPALKHLIIQKN